MTGILGALLGGPLIGTFVGITNQTGDVTKNAANTIIEDWLTDGTGSQWECRATKQSGTAPSGDSLGSWLNLGTSRSWSVSNSASDGSTVSCVLLVEIGHSGASTALDSATITLEAVSNSFGGGG
jgi:hypothetical protein